MNDRDRILEVFTRELPHTARILNAPVVTEEIVFGPDHESPDDDQQPPKEWYDRHRAIMDELVAEGVLQTGEAIGEKVYGLTIDYQSQLEATVLRYLSQKARLLSDRGAERNSAGLRRRAEIIEDVIAALRLPVGS